MRREVERCSDDLSGVRGEHVLEDGRQRLARAFLVALEREHHLVLVGGDEAVEGGLELGREEPADPSESALVWEEGDDELGGADLEVLEGVLLGGLHGGAGDDAGDEALTAPQSLAALVDAFEIKTRRSFRTGECSAAGLFRARYF